jgi:ABC-2 type transport system permease protein
MAGSVLQEKREGTFRRLLVAPMNPAVMLAGKLAPYYIINLVQLVIMLGTSSLLFGMSLGAGCLSGFAGTRVWTAGGVAQGGRIGCLCYSLFCHRRLAVSL